MQIIRLTILFFWSLSLLVGFPVNAREMRSNQQLSGLAKDQSILPSPAFQLTWSQPTNLSRSGSASQPTIVAGSNGYLQAYWLDSFDGLVTAVYNGNVWSLPVVVPIQPPIPGQKTSVSNTSPVFIVDGQNRVHAFWYGGIDPTTGKSPLMENQMYIGTTVWSIETRIAESALVYNLATSQAGEIFLAYIRELKTALFEPGVLVRDTIGGASWQSAVSVDTSIYYRNLDAATSFIKTAASGGANSLVWTEPRLNRMYSADSFDGGNSWTQPQVVELAGIVPSNPIIFPLPSGGFLRVWQDAAQTSCTLYQQRLDIPGSASSPPTVLTPAAPTAGVTPANPSAVSTSDWSQPERILEKLQTCPTQSKYILDNGNLYWYWGVGTPTINLTVWDEANSQWIEPHALSLSFDDAETARFVQLDQLDLSISNDRMTLIGSDLTMGEVWASFADANAVDYTFSPPSPWIQPAPLSQPGVMVSDQTVVLDHQGWAHILWAQEDASSGASLLYSRDDTQQVLPPVVVFKGEAGEISKQPNLLADAQNNLHLCWVGGKSGQLLYSRAAAEKAGSAAGWVPEITLDSRSGISRPQIVQAPTGRLYILYAIPVNELRGVYLVYSDDSGVSWSKPALIFDAAKAGWDGVDHPSLAVDANGGVHIAYSRMQNSGAFPTEGIYYTRATQAQTAVDLGDKALWIEPFEIAPAGNDWPRVVIVGDQLHLLYTDFNDINHRWVNINMQQADGAGWGDVSKPPGWQNFQYTGQPPFSTASDAFNIYLVGAVPGGSGLMYSVWSVDPQDTSSGRWSQQEIYNPGAFWTNFSSSAIASTIPTGERIVISWLAFALPSSQATPVPDFPAILYAFRSLEAVQAPPASTSEPVIQPTDAPATTLEPTSSPTPLVISNETTPAKQSPVSPQVIGGGLAAVIVIIIFVGILMRGRSQTP